MTFSFSLNAELASVQQSSQQTCRHQQLCSTQRLCSTQQLCRTQRLCRTVIRIVVVAEFCLMLTTRNLWWTNSASTFPQIPIFIQIPRHIDCLFVIAFVAVQLWVLQNPVRRNTAIACGCALLLAASNQHRLQPWHWLTCLMLAAYALNPAGIRIQRTLIASIYIYAALSRLDWPPASPMTASIANTLLELIGQTVGPGRLPTVIFMMTCAEFAIGCGLLFSKTRRLAMVASLILHSLLLVALSPLGLNHHEGVLVWNLMFLFVNPLIFRQTVPNEKQIGIAIVAGTFPLLGVFGLADHWLCWKLYSPKADVVRLFVADSVVDDLPVSIRRFVQPAFPTVPAELKGRRPDLQKSWHAVRLDQFSLQTLNAPLYPQANFQQQVADCILPPDVSTDDVFLTVETSPWWPWSARIVHAREFF